MILKIKGDIKHQRNRMCYYSILSKSKNSNDIVV